MSAELLGSGTFHGATVGPYGRHSVQLRTNEQSLLAARISGRFSAPRIERILLQRSPIAECQRPRQGTGRVYQAQMQGRFGRALASRQERDAGNRGRYLTFQRANGGLPDLLRARLLS